MLDINRTVATPTEALEKEGVWLPAVVNYLLERISSNYKLIQDKITKKKGIWKNIALALNSKVWYNAITFLRIF